LNIALHSIGFPSPLQILDQIDHGARRVTLRAQTTAASAPCPACAIPSRRVHGAYWRSLGDVACFGRPTLLLVRVRRFRCTAPACPRRTFAEPLSGVAQARARQTDRLRAVHRSIGLALGGNPGARLAAAMGVPVSRTTLLTRVRIGDAVPVPPVRVLGVDAGRSHFRLRWGKWIETPKHPEADEYLHRSQAVPQCHWCPGAENRKTSDRRD
jgi:zinc-finger of transposase IS204/IS1001/IS1096/IS1165